MPIQIDRHRKRVATIDGLRGVAIICVIFTHYVEFARALTSSHDALVRFTYSLDLGRVGVVLFFAISGFVISNTLRREPDKGVAAFAINRFWRLFPAFWLSVIPSAIARSWFQGFHFTLSDIVLNFTMLPGVFDAQFTNGAYWTLETELAFYALCALIYVGRSERSAFVYSIVSALCLIIFMSSQPSVFGDLLNNSRLRGDQFSLALHLGIMAWGAVVRMWWSGDEVDPLSKAACATFAAYWVLWEPSKLFYAYWSGNFFDVDQRLICGYSLGLGLFLLGLLAIPITWRWLTWVGRISYSLYLLHGAVGMALVGVVAHIQPRVQGLYWISAAFFVLLVLGVSHLMFQYVERPSIRLGHRLAARSARYVSSFAFEAAPPSWRRLFLKG